jgi:ABC-type glycerol-3-phosphate transport system permease component
MAVSSSVTTQHPLTWHRVTRRLGRAGLYGWVAVMLIVAFIPLWWMVKTAFSPDTDIYTPVLHLIPPSLPPRTWPPYIDMSQFACAFGYSSNEFCHHYNFATNILNSTIVSLVTTLITVVSCTLAAYSLTRLRYPGRAALARSVLFVYLIPEALLFIPLFEIMSALHLTNTYTALIISYLTFSMPFCTWMLIGYLKGVPVEIEEAALIDGCNRLQALARVIFPMAAPGVVAAALFTFTGAWNEFLYALVLITNGDLITMPVALSGLIHGDQRLYGPMMAGSLIYFIPVLLLYFLGQRFLVGGLAAGAVKA